MEQAGILNMGQFLAGVSYVANICRAGQWDYNAGQWNIYAGGYTYLGRLLVIGPVSHQEVQAFRATVVIHNLAHLATGAR